MPSHPGIEELIQDAGCSAELAELLTREDVSVATLVRANLAERREVLRALGCSFGAILAINRVLERYRDEGEEGIMSDALDSESGDDDDDRDLELQDDADDVHNASASCIQAISVDVAAVALHSLQTMGVSGALAAQLQAAALLLASAEQHTLRALQAYLGNVCSYPERSCYRGIELTNPLFQERVWGVPGGASLLRAALEPKPHPYCSSCVPLLTQLLIIARDRE